MTNIIGWIVCIVIIAIYATLSLRYGLSGRSGMRRRKGETTQQERDRERSGLPVEGFDQREYIQTHSQTYGISNMGVSLDEREIHVYDLKDLD